MPKNKNALERYMVIDRCLSNQYRQFTIYDLVDKCSAALGYNVSKRTIYSDLNYIESPEGWGDYGVEIERKRDNRNRVYFRYKDTNKNIRNSALSEIEANQLKETITMLARFKGMPQFEWVEEMVSRLNNSFQLAGNQNAVVGFEQNLDLRGSEHLSILFGYIINKQCVEIKYRTFSGAERTWQISPYYIKQYNQRWFLFGQSDDYETLSNLALDRIVSIKAINKEYRETDINFEEYFDDVVGVTIPADGKIEEVVLKFTPRRFPYIESKPLHLSQRVRDRENGIVAIKAIPNRELIAQISSFGSDVEVLEPQTLREELARQVALLNEKYNSVQIDFTPMR